jgi:hypothetical protein
MPNFAHIDQLRAQIVNVLMHVIVPGTGFVDIQPKSKFYHMHLIVIPHELEGTLLYPAVCGHAVYLN